MAYVPEWLRKQKGEAVQPQLTPEEIELDQVRKLREKDERRLELLEKHGVLDDDDGYVDQASEHVHIPSDNVGFKLLAKMGWKENTGLGKTEQGRIEPVSATQNPAKLGLGKDTLDMKYAEEATKERLLLEVEKPMTEEDKKNAVLYVIEEQQKTDEFREMLSDFYCITCDKQYKNVNEMENHLSSYDHHHKKRLTELKRTEGSRGEDERRKKQKREEDKEHARVHALAMARQVALSAPPPPPPPSSPPPPPPSDDPISSVPPPSLEQSSASLSIGAFTLGMSIDTKKKKKKN